MIRGALLAVPGTFTEAVQAILASIPSPLAEQAPSTSGGRGVPLAMGLVMPPDRLGLQLACGIARVPAMQVMPRCGSRSLRSR